VGSKLRYLRIQSVNRASDCLSFLRDVFRFTLNAPCRVLPQVADVRVLGAIGVVELRRPVDAAAIQRRFVARGVWVRPFGRLVYLMPAYCIADDDLQTLCSGVAATVAEEGAGP